MIDLHSYFFKREHIDFFTYHTKPTDIERQYIYTYLKFLDNDFIFCSFNDYVAFSNSDDLTNDTDVIEIIYLDLLDYIKRCFEDPDTFDFFELNFGY